MKESVVFERDDAIAIISINDAPYNRMSLDFMDSLEELVIKIEKDNSIRAVVLTAEGLDNFSVGMNLKQLPEGVESKYRYVSETNCFFCSWMRATDL